MNKFLIALTLAILIVVVPFPGNLIAFEGAILWLAARMIRRWW